MAEEMKALKVSIFVPTFNRAASLKACLGSITQQSYKNFEVIIVDGGSTDTTQEVIDAYSQKMPVIFFCQKKKGIVAAANEALEKASGDIFTRIDDDVICDSRWLEAIVATFNSREDVGGVTGPTIISQKGLSARDLTYYNTKMKKPNNIFWKILAKIYYGYLLENQPFAVSKFFRSGAFSIGSNYPKCLNIESLVEVDTLEACNWSCQKELLENIGGFDEKYLKGLGDYHEADVPFKIKRLGHKLIFNPGAKVQHNILSSQVSKIRPASFWRSQNFILFYFRHIKPNTWDKFFRFSSYLIFINLYWLFKFLTSMNLKVLMGVLGTFVGLIKYLPELRKE